MGAYGTSKAISSTHLQARSMASLSSSFMMVGPGNVNQNNMRAFVCVNFEVGVDSCDEDIT